eukprot:m.16422 g.16422  ORF g.16422 m.16422 type:complete len:445 (-) comp4613_c0_seq2:481-1815(-)
MAGGGVSDGSTYSPLVGGMFVFNLIVGAGALAMPKAFGESGYIGGSVLIAVLAFCSYITVTYVVEAMSIANALIRKKEKNIQSVVTPLIASDNAEGEKDGVYNITIRTEMAEMAQEFFPSWGVKLFYLCIIIYLYGDLCIYVVAIPKSLQSVVCGENNASSNSTPSYMDHACMGSINTKHAYYLFLTFFAVVIGPFCFFNVQKTKLLQIFTTGMRWVTFILMIAIAIFGISSKKGFTKQDHIPKPSHVGIFHASGLPVLFGVAIYSFMCHHSLPSLVVPIKNKTHLSRVFLTDFALILLFYCLLCFTAVFRFKTSKLEDLYTLNFEDFSSEFVSYFLALFPVVTLSANFPIIAITLRNNLCELIIPKDKILAPWIKHVCTANLPPLSMFTLTTSPAFLLFFKKNNRLGYLCLLLALPLLSGSLQKMLASSLASLAHTQVLASNT